MVKGRKGKREKGGKRGERKEEGGEKERCLSREEGRKKG